MSDHASPSHIAILDSSENSDPFSTPDIPLARKLNFSQYTSSTKDEDCKIFEEGIPISKSKKEDE